MPNYGLYQLVNSREIPRFVGSPVPELSAVAQTLQGRYDTAQQYDDALESTIGQTTSLQADNAALQQLKTQYRARLAERAKKGDYENMLRDVQKDARDFVAQYKPIAANQAAVSQYYNDLQERVAKGEIAKSWADRLYDASTRGYSGLKKNPVTGQYENQFKGITAVKNIDLQDWVDKALKGLDPQKIGSEVRKDEGGFYVTRGSTKEYLGMDRILPALQAAMKTDPMFQSYAQQRAFLDSYHGKFVSEESQKDKPYYAAVKKLADDSGISFNDALQGYFANASGRELMSEITNIGSKYMKNNHTSKYSVDGETESTRRTRDKEGQVTFGIGYAALDNGANVENAAAFGKIVENADAQIKNAQNDFGAWLNAKDAQGNELRRIETVGTRPNAYERFYEKDPDTGKWVDVTAIGNQKRQQLVGALKQKQQLDEVHKAAIKESGFDPQRDMNPSTIVEAMENVTTLNKIKAPFTYVKDLASAFLMSNGQMANMQPMMKAMGVKNDEKFYQDVVKEVNRISPQYKKYSEALLKRVNGGVTPNEMLEVRDENARKSLKNLLTGMAGEGIGFEKGMAPLTIGTGKDQGTQLTSDQYDQIMSDMEPVGIINDTKDGKTKVIFRTNQKVRGKKVEGENLILEANTITGLDDYLRKTLPARDYVKFNVDGQLKAMLGTNVSGKASLPLGVDRSGKEVSINITRNKGEGTFTVDFPTQEGISRKQFNSYGAVADAIAQYQMMQNQ